MRLRQTVIRHQAALSSISNLGYPNSKDSKMRDYGELLEKEQTLMIECVEKGAALQIILAPRTAQRGDRERLVKRFDKLLGFLSRDDEEYPPESSVKDERWMLRDAVIRGIGEIRHKKLRSHLYNTGYLD